MLGLDSLPVTMDLVSNLSWSRNHKFQNSSAYAQFRLLGPIW
jgi:hypothetical protein